MRLACAIAGAFSLTSLLLWAFAGIPVWASTGESFARGYVLFIIHCLGMLAGAMATQNDLWKQKP